MWIAVAFSLVLVFLLVLLVRISLSNDDQLSQQIFLRCVELNKTFVRQTNVSLKPFVSYEERDIYASQLLAFSSVAVIFSVMSFSKSLPHLLDLKFKPVLSSSSFKIYHDLMLSICIAHQLGQVVCLNDVFEFLYASLLDTYKFKPDEVRAFFKFVTTIINGSLPPNHSLKRFKPLSFHV